MQNRFEHRIELHVLNRTSSASPCMRHCVSVDIGGALYNCDELDIALSLFDGICSTRDTHIE